LTFVPGFLDMLRSGGFPASLEITPPRKPVASRIATALRDQT